MIFPMVIVAFLIIGWAEPEAARAMIPRDAPVSIVAPRCFSTSTSDGTLAAELRLRSPPPLDPRDRSEGSVLPLALLDQVVRPRPRPA